MFGLTYNRKNAIDDIANNKSEDNKTSGKNLPNLKIYYILSLE